MNVFPPASCNSSELDSADLMFLLLFPSVQLRLPSSNDESIKNMPESPSIIKENWLTISKNITQCVCGLDQPQNRTLCNFSLENTIYDIIVSDFLFLTNYINVLMRFTLYLWVNDLLGVFLNLFTCASLFSLALPFTGAVEFQFLSDFFPDLCKN